jgi:hypothetical protein
MAKLLVEQIIALIASTSTLESSEGGPRSHSSCGPNLPKISFEWNVHLERDRVTPLQSPGSRREAKETFLEGLQYAYGRRISGDCSAVASFVFGQIKRVHLGAASDRRSLITASSPQDLGAVWFAGNWGTLTPQRVAANVFHEAVHQALYRRELVEAAALRRNSIAYSPWKKCERPGRWVWHAFWTFSVHCAFLAEAINPHSRDFQEDAVEVAVMYLRLRQCVESIHMFNVVEDTQEVDRIRWVGSLVFDRIENGENCELWLEQIARHRRPVEHEFESWVQRIVSSKAFESINR